MKVGFDSARNLLKLWLLLAIVCGAAALPGAAINGWSGAALFAFAGLLAGTAVYAYCDKLVLGMLGARELLLAEQPALYSLAERLALRAGVVPPRLYLLLDDYPRSLSVGRGPSHGAIALSLGMIATASPAELEGLIAHELAHIRTRDCAVQALVVVFALTALELSRIGGFLQRALLFVLGPLAAGLTHAMLSPKRELRADRRAALVCGTPHGLADALARLHQAADLLPLVASPATAPLYPVHLLGDDGLAGMFDSHPPFAARIRALRALDPDWKERLRAA